MFLTKELLHSVIDRVWDVSAEVFNGAGPVSFHLSFLVHPIVDCVFFGVFFWIALKVFQYTHADEYLRRLMLLVIKDPKNYLIFFQKFACDRIEAIGRYDSKRLLQEIEVLLAVGKERFGLHHKRSVCFLLGLNYPVFRNTLERLESEELSLSDAREALAESVTKPLTCLTEPLLRYTGTSKRGHLINLLAIAAEPSYDKALELFYRELKKPIENLQAQVRNGLSEHGYRGVVQEAKDLLLFLQVRCKARMGFPVYDFIDQKNRNKLSCFPSASDAFLGSWKSQAESSVDELAKCLNEFADQQEQSRQAFKKALRPASLVPQARIDPEKEVICLYGFSCSVKLFIDNVLPMDRRANAGFMLIKTIHLATTPQEEQRMRDELLEMRFIDVAVHGFQDLLLFDKLHRPLVFCLGFEVINLRHKRAVFHFGAGQLLHRLIWSLKDKGNNVRVLLIGAKYKDLDFTITAPQVADASIFDYGSLHNVDVIVVTN